jgi:hypothetical protein
MEEKGENFMIEKIERAGEIINEPVLSKTIREVLGSKHRKVTIEPSFCACGVAISKENVKRCSHCKRLICKECAMPYVNEIHCSSCLDMDHRIFLTKPDYLILLCISADITNKSTVFELTGIEPHTVTSRIEDLINKYVSKQPANFFERIFPKIRLTNLGKDALATYEKIFGNDLDCVCLKKKILELKKEEEKGFYRLRTEVKDEACIQQDC